jgi:hypothetical protein
LAVLDRSQMTWILFGSIGQITDDMDTVWQYWMDRLHGYHFAVLDR